jgi:hypothetical protein
MGSRFTRISRAAEAAPPCDDDLLDPATVADWIDLTTAWLQAARGKNIGPKFIRLGPRAIRYRRGDVAAWLEARTHA